jgi:hypothetical protein
MDIAQLGLRRCGLHGSLERPPNYLAPKGRGARNLFEPVRPALAEHEAGRPGQSYGTGPI